MTVSGTTLLDYPNTSPKIFLPGLKAIIDLFKDYKRKSLDSSANAGL
jgi:hypothetical protein